ncbi:hypothetical protein PVAP13_3KG161881 [Panicum virgatum]|uniref:Uncharacterized protein n=1 Tax=Panicum virgatum TaxID=38727 RepID=A0A8T0UKI3_PANVG|nr:hypothetical protein PVAP13_3KG161881 [Panicum virgatum]
MAAPLLAHKRKSATRPRWWAGVGGGRHGRIWWRPDCLSRPMVAVPAEVRVAASLADMAGSGSRWELVVADMAGSGSRRTGCVPIASCGRWWLCWPMLRRSRSGGPARVRGLRGRNGAWPHLVRSDDAADTVDDTMKVRQVAW